MFAIFLDIIFTPLELKFKCILYPFLSLQSYRRWTFAPNPIEMEQCLTVRN